MASYYSVIRYVPDVVRDERINVGVVVFSGGWLCYRFVKDWERVRRFADQDERFVEDLPRALDRIVTGLDEMTFREMVKNWMNSIQFSEPAGSILDVDELLEDVSRRFLHDQ